MSKPYRVDYTVPEVHEDKQFSIFVRADNLTLAKHKVSALPYWGWKVQKIELDTENNYRKWVEPKRRG